MYKPLIIIKQCAHNKSQKEFSENSQKVCNDLLRSSRLYTYTATFLDN